MSDMTPERLAEIRKHYQDALIGDKKGTIRKRFNMWKYDYFDELFAHIDAQQRTIEQAEAEVARLREIIANAPHRVHCKGKDKYPNLCDCWKREALESEGNDAK